MAESTERVALVTGAAGGLGLAIAARLANDGFRMALIDIDGKGAHTAAKTIDRAKGYGCDITNEDEVAKTLERIDADFGSWPDALVNNAGIVRFGGLLEQSVEDFRKVVEVNLIGTFVMCRAAGLGMVARGSGTIVNITSLNAFAPSPDAGAYPASKAAVAKLTEQMALSLGPSGVRVNAVAPGFINAGMSSPIYEDPDVLAARGSSVPAGRIGTADDVANAVSFLVSEEADYIHGQQLLVDGGIFCSLKNHLPRTPPASAEK